MRLIYEEIQSGANDRLVDVFICSTHTVKVAFFEALCSISHRDLWPRRVGLALFSCSTTNKEALIRRFRTPRKKKHEEGPLIYHLSLPPWLLFLHNIMRFPDKQTRRFDKIRLRIEILSWILIVETLQLLHYLIPAKVGFSCSFILNFRFLWLFRWSECDSFKP